MSRGRKEHDFRDKGDDKCKGEHEYEIGNEWPGDLRGETWPTEQATNKLTPTGGRKPRSLASRR